MDSGSQHQSTSAAKTGKTTPLQCVVALGYTGYHIVYLNALMGKDGAHIVLKEWLLYPTSCTEGMTTRLMLLCCSSACWMYCSLTSLQYASADVVPRTHFFQS